MFKGVSYVFIVPWLVLLAIAIGIGVRIGRRDSAKWALALAALTIANGVIVLGLVLAVLIAVSYASGGH